MNAVVLCGGKGTRLRGVTGRNRPKCLVEIGGKPIIAYVLEWLWRQGGDTTVLCPGVFSEQFGAALGCVYRTMDLHYSTEGWRRGTGGAVQCAVRQFRSRFDRSIPVLNGDTMLTGGVLLNIGDSDVTEIRGENFLTKETGTAFRIVHKEFALKNRDPLESVKSDVKEIEKLSYLDIGTPKGYDAARKMARRARK